MAGTSYINYAETSVEAANADSVFNDLEHAWIDNTTNKDGAKITIKGKKEENRLMSYFGRANYNYRDTYFFNATLRADGSSKFAPGNQWSYFPSASAGWVASNEEFLKDSQAINFLKVRASWGQVGNQSIRSFQYLAEMRSKNTNYIFGDTEGALKPGT
ncbi:hypothetical protein D3C85_1473130 [compost metagenome]